MAFNPYLNFDGTCRQALTRYHEIFGGDLVLLPMSTMPSDDPLPPEVADRILHGSLRVGDSVLMASDAPLGDFPPMQSVYVSVDMPDVDEARRVFAALAAGGQVEMPLGATFWSPAFGMCKDSYGTPWMISVEEHEA